MNNMEYKSVELHCHTYHSDGGFSVSELFSEAKKLNLNGIAITDHNTMSAYDDPQISATDGLCLLKGIEWTTFFGHILVIDCDKFVDWRYATVENIDEYLKDIKKNNGVVGIAHPYHLGSPFCTGCHFEFDVKDWNNVDYIEVWSRDFPMNVYKNKEAYKLWMRKLNEGYKIAATSGRDWHGVLKDSDDFANTYLGIDGEITANKMKLALQKGKTFVSVGPLFEFSGIDIGDEIKAGEISFDVKTSTTEGKNNACTKNIKITNNEKIYLFDHLDNQSITINFKAEEGFIVIEACGDYFGESDKMLAFTSPIYVL